MMAGENPFQGLLDGASEFALSFSETPENLTGIEVGAFRVLGDALTGGNA